MKLLSRAELSELLAADSPPFVSIFMPTQRAGAQTRQNPIRLKNLLGRAEDDLTGNGLRRPEAKQLLSPADALLADAPFWSHQSDGLALFVSRRQFRCYRLPVRFEELVVVSDNFHIKPLIPFFAADGRFYVLALSQKQVRLLQCSRLSVRDIELTELPTDMAELTKYIEFDRGLQMHSTASADMGKKGAAFHGHGGGSDDALHKKVLLDFLHMVDRGLRKCLVAERVPIVLAGVDYLRSLYRSVTALPNVLEAGIAGNPDERSAQELQRQGWQVVAPEFLREQQQAIAHYRRLVGSDRVCQKLEDAILAAWEGRVEALFVSSGQQLWGRYNPKTKVVYLHIKEEPGDEDLLDFSAIHALRHGATVFALEPENMPAQAPIAAILRH